LYAREASANDDNPLFLTGFGHGKHQFLAK
jgi:hypothetical protein